MDPDHLSTGSSSSGEDDTQQRTGGGGGGKCHHCGETGHIAKECKAKRQEVLKRRKCFICGKEGKDPPQAKTIQVYVQTMSRPYPDLMSWCRGICLCYAREIEEDSDCSL